MSDTNLHVTYVFIKYIIPEQLGLMLQFFLTNRKSRGLGWPWQVQWGCMCLQGPAFKDQESPNRSFRIQPPKGILTVCSFVLVVFQWTLGLPQWNRWVFFFCQVTEDIAIVGTLDFFTPIVDEPEATAASVSWVKTGCNEQKNDGNLFEDQIQTDPNRKTKTVWVFPNIVVPSNHPF